MKDRCAWKAAKRGRWDGNTFPSVNGSNLFFVLAEKERHCHIEMLSIKSLSSRFWFEWLSPKPRGLSSCAFFPNLTSIGSLKEVEGKKRLRAVSPLSVLQNTTMPSQPGFYSLNCVPSEKTAAKSIYIYSIMRFMSVFFFNILNLPLFTVLTLKANKQSVY